MPADQGTAVVGMPERRPEDDVAILLADPYSFPADGFVSRETARMLTELPPRLPPGTGVVLRATDTGETWTVPERFPLQGGVLATAGHLVFYGTLDGWFRAVDSRDGRIAWAYKTNSQIAGQPITYSGSDNRQYVAVVSGRSGGAGAVGDDDVDSRDLTAASGYANALPDLPRPAEAAGRLQIFRLP